MRALFSWYVLPGDPDQQLIMDVITACLPQASLTPLTKYTARLDVVDSVQYEQVANRLVTALSPYAGRVWTVLSLHEDNDPIYMLPTGTPMPPQPVLIV